MFAPEVYAKRRSDLAEAVGSGTILLLGHQHAAITYAANVYPFRQESSFSYFFGLDEPNSAGLIDATTGTSVLYGHDPDITDIIWEGDTAPLSERGAAFGVHGVMPMRALAADLTLADTVRFLPATRPSMAMQTHSLLGVSLEDANAGDQTLTDAVVSLRSIKNAAEVDQIVIATNRTKTAHLHAMEQTRAGLHEFDVVRSMRTQAATDGWVEAYGPIFSVRGEVLHNPFHRNEMTDGALVLHDGALLSDLGYGSDVTRTFPVNGHFTEIQRSVYETVLEAQTRVIARCKPGVLYRDMHTLAMTTIFDGLQDLGITRGNTAEAVEEGAAALFMPHGIGHMLGLDVHDMEGIGETNVGYDQQITRSKQFGRNNLRLGRALKEGFVFTVEPGCYFIPALIDRWEAEGTWKAWIDFDVLQDFRNFGGIRIEDVVHQRSQEAVVLGEPIPRDLDEIEAAYKG